MPAEVVTIDISEPVRELRRGKNELDLKLFVTRSGQPLGFVDLKGRLVASRDDVLYEIARQLPEEGLRRLAGIPPKQDTALSSRPKVTVVLCTADREDRLKPTLDALAQLDYPDYETIVVDNRPGGGVRRAVEGYPVILVEEPSPGLSRARNTGTGWASGEILAFTDDDCTPSRDWLDRLVAPFEDPQVMCVTGLVVPGELESEAQELFEEYGGLGRGFETKWFGREFFERKHFRAVPTWHMGATANAAFRRSALEEIGLFDVTLGVGTPTGCSEDTYAFYQLLKLGHECVYEPRAYVYHRHRSSYAGLRKQLFGYGRGHYAYHTKCLLRYGDLRALFHMAAFMPFVHLARLGRSLMRRSHFPVRLILWEMLGNTLGPASLVYSVFRARASGRKACPEA